MKDCDLSSCLGHFLLLGFGDDNLNWVFVSLRSLNFEAGNTSHTLHLSDNVIIA
jgi:hypothetical protein